MEHYNYRLNRAIKPGFDEVGEPWKVHVFDTEYILLKGMQGGLLYVTRHGWPWVSSIIPANWYVDGRFRESGRRLVGSTGTVYWVPLPNNRIGSYPVVLKFNRFAQDAPVCYTIGTSAGANDHMMRGARFLSPFEEFTLLENLRSSVRLHPHIHCYTQQPLAIYCPAIRYPSWKLGRSENNYWAYDNALQRDQARHLNQKPVTYEWDRAYITLFSWIEGIDAEDAADKNLLRGDSMESLTRQTQRDLAELGFAVHDHKPRHILLRWSKKQKQLLRRHGKLIHALIDYELLYRPNHPYPNAPAL